MVSDHDREHFRRIADAERELERQALHDAAGRDPGLNIEIGLELSEFAAAFGADLSRPDDVSPASLWAARTNRATRRA